MIKTETPFSVLVAEYAAKTEERRKLEGEVKKLGTELSILDERLVEAFADAGIQNVKTAIDVTEVFRMRMRSN
jgi:hypothetical protein